MAGFRLPMTLLNTTNIRTICDREQTLLNELFRELSKINGILK